MNTWLYWAVPENRATHYLVLMCMALFVLPYILCIRYTLLGYLFNMIWLDLIYYWTYKFSEKNKKDKDDNIF